MTTDYSPTQFFAEKGKGGRLRKRYSSTVFLSGASGHDSRSFFYDYFLGERGGWSHGLKHVIPCCVSLGSLEGTLGMQDGLFR